MKISASETVGLDQKSKETEVQEVRTGREFRNLVGRSYVGSIDKYLSVANRLVGTIREEWCDHVLLEQGYNIGDEFSRSEYEPEALFIALAGYDGGSTYQLNSSQRQHLQRAVSKVTSYFKDAFGTLDPLPLDEGLWSVVKKETSAGLPSLLPKRFVFDQEVSRAQALLEKERLSKSSLKSDRKQAARLPSPEPCVAYYRTQTSVTDEGEPKKKVRMVWGYPLSMILVEACYARPIIDYMLMAVTPVSLGYRKSEIGAKVASSAWWPVAGTFDWSKWDANVPTQLVTEAFAIARKFFSAVDEAHWQLITSYFATCGIVMPDGLSYRGRRKGIPSGSFFTSIIGSLANLIAIHFLAYEQGLDVIGIDVLGDDSRVGLTGKISIKRMSLVAKRCFGMKINLEKLNYGGPEIHPRYLGHDWYRGRIRRPIIETVVRIKYPERFNDTWWDDRYDKLISLYGDNVDSWPLISAILRKKGLAYPQGSGEQFLLRPFHDLAGFTMTESPDMRGERKRFAAASLK